MIFQTEKQLKEYGEKLSEGNKANIESALTELKSAHESKNISAIKPALEKINNAWQAASTEMYAQNPQGETAQQQNQNTNTEDNVQDADYEEVK